jgi:hypothetical protein
VGDCNSLWNRFLRLLNYITYELRKAANDGRNWAFNEAVIISVLAENFADASHPLGRMRYTKLSYLYRYANENTEGYLKKAAGPYNPATRYKGPERIAQTSGYVKAAKAGNLHGFVAGEQAYKARTYFDKWYGPTALEWLRQFRYEKNEALELLTTVDKAVEELRSAGKEVTVQSVKEVLLESPSGSQNSNGPCSQMSTYRQPFLGARGSSAPVRLMSTVGQIEKRTQARVVALFRDRLGHDYLGKWIDRKGFEGNGNRNIEPELLTAWLRKQGIRDGLINRALYELEKGAGDTSKSLYDRNKAVYDILRYGAKVRPEAGENTIAVWLIDWKRPEANHFAIAEEMTVKGADAKASTKRPDVALYVNGIALGVLELKRSTVSVAEGIRQNLDNQKRNSSSLSFPRCSG